MNYQVYITDGIDVVELDTENIDINSVFAISDIQDIGARKDNTKTIQFKGTKTNNNAFGTFFDLGRTSDFDYDNAILFNYNPLRKVTALVYDDTNLIFRGSLRIQEINIDKNGVPIYNTVLTGSLIDLKAAIQDRTLSDLDFSDLRHPYSISSITESWSSTTVGYDVSTSAFTSTPFQYGKNYVYPNIDYGNILQDATSINQLHMKNFKPAIYVREYFDRIFGQSNISGFTYEIKGSSEFIDMFNHLIIPDNQVGFLSTVSGITTTCNLPLIYTPYLFNKGSYGSYDWAWNRLIPIGQIVHPNTTIAGPLFQNHLGYYNRVLDAQKDLTTSGKLEIVFDSFLSSSITGITSLLGAVRFVKRPPEDNEDGDSGWTEILRQEFYLETNVGNQTHNYSLDIGNLEIKKGEQIGVQISTAFPSGNYYLIAYSVASCKLSFPRDERSFITFQAEPAVGDYIIPKPPINIKQIDFIKSIMHQFNLYCYTTMDNPKNMIFQKYDDYYVYSLPDYIKDSALDWTSKIDYNNGFKIKSNIDLPKSYLFTHKEDGDWFTDLYKKTFNETYGQFSFNDEYGLQDTKKVELIFSPIVLISDTGTDRKYPALYTEDGGIKKVDKTNIRMGYYNGLQPCFPYTINYLSSASTIVEVYSGATYPQFGNYYLTGTGSATTVVNDIHFNQPRQVYCSLSDDYFTVPNSYQNYYINQVTNLTNPDVTYVECKALLNDIDISNLDLRTPIYINTGTMNGAYFKLLKVQYNGSDVPSQIQLQKIAF